MIVKISLEPGECGYWKETHGYTLRDCSGNTYGNTIGEAE